MLVGCDAEEAWSIFYDEIADLVQSHVPTGPRTPPNKPFLMNCEVLGAVRKKRQL
jgi:hypothetical protein